MWYLYTMDFTQPQRGMKFCQSQVNEWNCRTSSSVKLTRLRQANATFSLSYVEYKPSTSNIMKHWSHQEEVMQGKASVKEIN
jgi:hypothetical protein